MISTPFSHFVNHLLAQEPWARERLQKHGGKLALFDLEFIQLRVRVASDGLLQAENDVLAREDVKLSMKAADLPLILADPHQAIRYVNLEGDADFAQTISGLSQDLTWEIEDDLSKIIGDVAARRAVLGVQRGRHYLEQSHRHLQASFAEYVLEENPLLVRPAAVREMGEQVNQLRDDLERLIKRVEKLEKMKVSQ